jgi:hypothetical protein
MKSISKAVAGAIIVVSLLGGGAGVAIAFSGAPAAHPAPLAATAVEYAL